MPRLSLALSAFLVLAVLSVFTVVAVLTAHASAVAPTQEIKPGALPRGADVAIPHLDGKTVVDGDVRIPVKGAVVRLLGKSGTSYVVSTMNKHGTSSRILRFAADGTRTVIAEGEVFESQLSSDGLRVFATKYRSKHSTLTAWSVATGQVVATRRFQGYPSVLDALGDRVLLGAWGRGTLSWDLATGSAAAADQAGRRRGLPRGRPALELHHRPLQRRLHGGQPDQRDRRRPVEVVHGAGGVVRARWPPDGDRAHPLRRHRSQRRVRADRERPAPGPLQRPGLVRGAHLRVAEGAAPRGQRQAPGDDRALRPRGLRARRRPRAGRSHPGPASAGATTRPGRP